MTDKSIPEDANRTHALLALAATAKRDSNACPSDQQLSEFISGQLQGETRQAMLGHLNGCSSCYQHWLEVASYLNEQEQPALAPEKSPWFSRLRVTLDSWFPSSFIVTGPIAAVAVVMLAVVFWPTVNHLDKTLDAGYTMTLTQHGPAIKKVALDLPLPTKGEVFAFSEAGPNLASQALAAGLWAGKQTMLAQDTSPLPAHLAAPPGAERWSTSAWRDYYRLGRWIALLWAQAQIPRTEPDWWQQQQAYLQKLAEEFSKQSAAEPAAQQAKTALARLQPLFAKLEYHNASAHDRHALRRRLEMTMQQLAP